MDELAALEVSAVRALEIRDDARVVWTDADRARASREAAESVGEQADTATFIVARARLALKRIGERDKALPRAVRALRWRPWIAWAIVVGGFALGVAGDRIGSAQSINLLAPPVVALLLWNIAVYVVLVGGLLVRRGNIGDRGPLRILAMRVVTGMRARLAGRGSARGETDGIVSSSITALTADWLRLVAPLYTVRTARILHFAAATLALGVIAGLYVRGLAFEYRVTWESTFLDAANVHRVLAMLLAPGSVLSGIAMPGVAQLESIRAPASENAAAWLHLLVASVVAIVIIPRLLLGIGTGIVERRRAARVLVPLGEPYYQRLSRRFRGGPVRVHVIPYSYTMPAGALAGLEAIVARAFTDGAALTVESPVTYGDEDTFAKRAPTDGQPPVIALFNLTATPESAAHGAFVKVLAGVDPAQPVLALVDESAFRAHWPGDDQRLAQRRRIWSEVLIAHRVVPIFVDLVAPDPAFAEAAINAALSAHDAIAPATPAPS